MSDFWVFCREAFRRLVATIRQEGWGVAARKTGQFLGRYLRPNRAAVQGAAYLRPFWQDMARHGAFHARPVQTARPRVAMIGDLGLAQCRKYRVQQPAELWALAGVDYETADWRDVAQASAVMQQATHLMIYRVPASPELEMYLYEARRLGLPVAYDLDDPLFCIAAYEGYSNMTALPAALKSHFLAEAPRYLAAMNQADIVTVSTPGMVARAQLYTSRPVYLRRNFADTETLAAAETALAGRGDRQGGFRVAFSSGSMGHEADFAQIADDLSAFLAGGADHRLVLLGHFDLKTLPEALRSRTEHHPFTDYASYLHMLAGVDCAVMPLGDDAFNACKSAVRVIDAAAVAVPSLVADIGDLPVLVQDGISGHVLGAKDSWLERLDAMAQSPQATSAMGQAARRHLLESWQAQTGPDLISGELLDWVRG